MAYPFNVSVFFFFCSNRHFIRAFCRCLSTHIVCSLSVGKKQSVLSGDSDDDGGPNTYDYNDSFIDDKEEGKEVTEA